VRVFGEQNALSRFAPANVEQAMSGNHDAGTDPLHIVFESTSSSDVAALHSMAAAFACRNYDAFALGSRVGGESGGAGAARDRALDMIKC
jgi:hypothetical protein